MIRLYLKPKTKFFQLFTLIFLAFWTEVAVLNVANAQSNDSAADAASNVAAAPIDIEINDIRLTATSERGRLIVDLSAPTQFSFVSLSDPIAIAVDVRATSLSSTPELQFPEDSIFSAALVEQVEGDRVRTLIELKVPAQVQQAYVLKAIDNQPARLVVDFVVDTEANFQARVQAARESVAVAATDAPLVDNSTSPGTTLSELELRPLILIDPGHGGVDAGAVMENGVLEKTLTLAFAKTLQEILIETGQFDVSLTREADVFLRLDERVEIARLNKASLFISIHADAFEDEAVRGASIYTRDEQATDVLDKVLAEQENMSDVLAGATAVVPDTAAVDLLVDLMRREMRRQAYLAASAIMNQVKPSIPVRPFPLRRANFFVLQAPDVPSVLLELGFVSNNQDARNLSSPEWRRRVAEAVARGIAQYFDDGGGT